MTFLLFLLVNSKSTANQLHINTSSNAVYSIYYFFSTYLKKKKHMTHDPCYFVGGEGIVHYAGHLVNILFETLTYLKMKHVFVTFHSPCFIYHDIFMTSSICVYNFEATNNYTQELIIP